MNDSTQLNFSSILPFRNDSTALSPRIVWIFCGLDFRLFVEKNMVRCCQVATSHAMRLTKMLKNQKSQAAIQNESFVGFSMSHLHTGFGLWSEIKMRVSFQKCSRLWKLSSLDDNNKYLSAAVWTQLLQMPKSTYFTKRAGGALGREDGNGMFCNGRNIIIHI